MNGKRGRRLWIQKEDEKKKKWQRKEYIKKGGLKRKFLKKKKKMTLDKKRDKQNKDGYYITYFSVKKICFRACCGVILFSGSYTSIFSNKSINAR